LIDKAVETNRIPMRGVGTDVSQIKKRRYWNLNAEADNWRGQ
jgi:hypothetical protein